MSNLFVASDNHPLIGHKMTRLRNKNTTSLEFRGLLKEITFFLGYEATRTLKTNTSIVDTPMHVSFSGIKLQEKVAIIPILRAGLGMADAMLEILPNAVVHHIGMYRVKESLLPVQYYNRLPKNEKCDVAYVLDPCIATSNTISAVCSILKKWGAGRVIVVATIGSREGIKRLQDTHPNVDVYVASIDETLSHDGMIIPGIGDAGDRLFATPLDEEPNTAAPQGKKRFYDEEMNSES